MFHCATSNARCEAPDFPHAESADQWGQFLSAVFRISVPSIQSGREVHLKYIVPATGGQDVLRTQGESICCSRSIRAILY